MKKCLLRGLAAAGMLLALCGALVLIETQLGQPMGLFSGSRPAGLGYQDGKFKACSWKPNCVSSTADKADARHYIAPLAFAGAPDAAWAKLKTLIATTPRATIVNESPGYLHVEFKSAAMGFVDDGEFALDAKAGAIQVRSSARLGIRDFDVNRNRVESLRSQLK